MEPKTTVKKMVLYIGHVTLLPAVRKTFKEPCIKFSNFLSIIKNVISITQKRVDKCLLISQNDPKYLYIFKVYRKQYYKCLEEISSQNNDEN